MSKSNTKKKIMSTQQFLPVLDVRGDIVITKDGRYVKIMELLPINFELRSPSEQADIISRFCSVIRTFPRIVQITIITTQSDVSPFVDELEACKAVEEVEGCREMLDDQINMIKTISETQGVTRRFFLSFPYEKQGNMAASPSFEEIKHALDDQGFRIRNVMESCGNSVIAAGSKDNTMNILYTCACKSMADATTWPEMKEIVIDKYRKNFGDDVNLNRIPATDFIAPVEMDSSLNSDYIVIDGKYVKYCYVPKDSYPSQVFGGWLQLFFSYMSDVYVNFWIQKEDVSSIKRRLEWELKNKIVSQSEVDSISLEYDEIANTIKAGYDIKSAIASGDDFCYMSTMLTIYADSLEGLNDKFVAMKQFCMRNDMDLKCCKFMQDSAFLASLPLAKYDQEIFAKSKHNIMASSLGSCYPFTAYELCDKGGVFLGTNASYGSPVFVNNFDTSKYQNANMMIFGPSGSGKTYTLLSMLLRMRQKGIQIFAVAPFKGHEFKRLTESIGGEFISIAPGQPQNINVMEIRKKDTANADLIEGSTSTNKGSILVEKIQNLHTLFSIIIPDISSQEKQILDEALVKTYGSYGITYRNKSLLDPNTPGHYKKMPILGDLHKELEKSGPEAKRLYTLLTRFVTGSARTFNQQTNVDLDNKFVVIDVSEMTDELLPMGMFIALDYILDKAEEDMTKRKVIAVDEMWRLMKASDLSAKYMVEIFKIIRGYGGSAIGATQDLIDVLANEHGAAIINNAKIKILLPLENRKEVEAVAKVVDLTAEEIRQIKRTEMAPNNDGKRRASKALMVANSNHVFIEIKASKKEHELITTDHNDLKKIAESKVSTVKKG